MSVRLGTTDITAVRRGTDSIDKVYRGTALVFSAGAGASTIAELYSGGTSGDYWDFGDASKLAVNADGTGGTPAVGSACRWVGGQRNSFNLRNTVSSVTRNTNGVSTSGAGYGLFCLPGFGWAGDIPQPYEILLCMELLTHSGADQRILFGSGPPNAQLLTGAASGQVRAYNGGYGVTLAPGLATEFTVSILFDGPGGGSALGSTPLATGAEVGTAALAGLSIGSNDGGSSATAVRLKRMALVGRKLSGADRAVARAWVSA